MNMTDLAIPTRTEQATWDKLTAKILIYHTTPVSTHVMVFRVNLPGREQYIFSYGSDGNDGFHVAFSEIIPVSENPEIKAIWENGWNLMEIWDWLGGVPDEYAPGLLLDSDDRALLYGSEVA